MAGTLSGAQRQKILSTQLSKVPGATGYALQQRLAERLYDELSAKGIGYRPRLYLSNEWGCPDGVPVIGIPFYLASRELCELVGEASGCPVEDEAEAMLYLRHEAGHAFSYAYELDKEPAWQKLFGNPGAPYPHYYRTRPFSPRYVRHIAGWYAQKHPDEDFAESFAVWLDPDSFWRERYRETPALEKLLYVEDAALRLGNKTPLNAAQNIHMPVEDMDGNLAEWCKARGNASTAGIKLPEIISSDLKGLFPHPQGEPAADILERLRPQLSRQVHSLTGLDSDLLHALLQKTGRLLRSLNLRVPDDEREIAVIKLTVFLTTLAMNFQKTGHFVEE